MVEKMAEKMDIDWVCLSVVQWAGPLDLMKVADLAEKWADQTVV